MDFDLEQNSKPPFAIRCKCCNKVVCYSYEKVFTNSVFCYVCTESINIFTEKYLKLNKYNNNLIDQEYNFDNKTIDAWEIHKATWAFAVNQNYESFTFFKYIKKES